MEVAGYLEHQQDHLGLNMAGIANQTSELIGGLFGQSLTQPPHDNWFLKPLLPDHPSDGAGKARLVFP